MLRPKIIKIEDPNNFNAAYIFFDSNNAAIPLIAPRIKRLSTKKNSQYSGHGDKESTNCG